MNTKSIIEIFRGDDSDALGYQTIVGTIHTDLDLTGCKAVFRYLGFFQEFDPIPEDGKLTIVIPSASSMQFPPGFGYASLKVYDIDRKVRTFTNRIPVFVKTMTPCRGGGEFDVEFSPFPELEPLKIFKGPNADDFDLYTGFISKIIDRASAQKYGLSMLFDAMNAEKTAEGGCAASPAAVKAAYDAIIKELTDNYYTAEQTEEAIDRVAAYYITYDAAGNPFPTYAALANATTVYSGGSVRVPTRNDYCVVLADETHQGAEYRYIYAVAEGQTTGSWQAQFPVEGVMTIDQTVIKNSVNPVAGGGVWSAIWGAATTAFSSIYDWVVSKLSEYRDKLDLNVYGYGNASVTFPDGFSITYDSETYTAPSGGESIEFYGPIESTSETGYYFWVPYEYKDDTDFNPVAQNVWCLTRDKYLGAGNPTLMLFATTSNYIISDWNTTAPTLTLSTGEVTGDAPTMARPLGATGDTLAKVSQMNTALASKANRAPNPTDGNLAALDSQGNPTDSGKTPYDFALTDIIAPEWDFNSTYKVGDLCTSFDNDPSHKGTWLYKCILAPAPQQMTPPEVDTTHWTLATVEDILAALRAALAGKANDSAIAPEFSATSTYDVGDVVMHECTRYKCTTAVTTAGAWSTVSSSFTAEDVQTAIEAGGGGDYASKVSGATAGHLASLTATGDLADSGKTPADFMAADAKIQRIYNEAETDALDDKGGLHKSSTQGNYFTIEGVVYPYYTMAFSKYRYKGSGNAASDYLYDPATGNLIYAATEAVRASCTPNLNPTEDGVDLAPQPISGWSITFTPKGTYLDTTSYANFALESVPTRTIAASTAYAVGDLLGDSGKAYRCISAYTSASSSPTAPSSDTTHWAEIPVLAGKADVSAIPYSLVTKTISNNAVTLDDRAINAVAVSSSLASLTVNFPTATSGKARDFGLRLTVASGITTAPELALPQGVTCENADGEAPEIGADGAATILYFTETASGVFLVKGEVVTAIS